MVDINNSGFLYGFGQSGVYPKFNKIFITQTLCIADMDINLKPYLKYFRLAAIVLMLLIIFKGIFVLGVLVVLSLSMSYIVNYLKIRKVGVELVTLVGVLAAVKYGPLTGAVISFVLISYHLLAGGFIANYVFWVIPAYTIAAAVAGILPGADIAVLGVYLSIAINVNNSLFTLVTSPAYLPNYLIYAITNVFFNFILFNAFGTFLKALIL